MCHSWLSRADIYPMRSGKIHDCDHATKKLLYHLLAGLLDLNHLHYHSRRQSFICIYPLRDLQGGNIHYSITGNMSVSYGLFEISSTPTYAIFHPLTISADWDMQSRLSGLQILFPD